MTFEVWKTCNHSDILLKWATVRGTRLQVVRAVCECFKPALDHPNITGKCAILIRLAVALAMNWVHEPTYENAKLLVDFREWVMDLHRENNGGDYYVHTLTLAGSELCMAPSHPMHSEHAVQALTMFRLGADWRKGMEDSEVCDILRGFLPPPAV